MKRFQIIVLSFLALLITAASAKVLDSGVYEWKSLIVKKSRQGQIREIIKSPVRSLEMFVVKAVTLPGEYGSTEYRIKKGFDELLIIKEGEAVISVNDRT